MLRSWLVQTSLLGLEVECGSIGVGLSSRANTPSLDGQEGGRPANTLTEASLQYALRIIEQCDRSNNTILIKKNQLFF